MMDVHEKVDSIKRIANQLLSNEQHEQAMKQYNEAIKIMKDNPGKIEGTLESELYSDRSYTYLLMKNYDKALSDAKTCVTVDANWYKGHLQEAKVHAAMGQQKEAILSYLGCLNCDCRQRPVPYTTVSDVVIAVVTEAMQLHDSNSDDTEKLLAPHKNTLCGGRFAIHLMEKPRYDCLLFLLQLYGKEVHIIPLLLYILVDLNAWSYKQEETLIFCLKNDIVKIDQIVGATSQAAQTQIGVLVGVLGMALQTGSTDLLKYMLTNPYGTEIQVKVACANDEPNFCQMLYMHKYAEFYDKNNIDNVFTLLEQLPHVDVEKLANPDNLDEEELEETRLEVGQELHGYLQQVMSIAAMNNKASRAQAVKAAWDTLNNLPTGLPELLKPMLK